MRVDRPDDDALFPQVKISDKWAHRLGAFREIGFQALGYLSVPNGLMIALTYYRGAEFIQQVFPSAVHWAGFYMLMGVGVMIFHYSIIYGPWQSFIQHQSEREDRSPQYRETVQNQQLIEDLHERMDRIERRAVADGGTIVAPMCQECGEGGVSGYHKGAPVIECPSCERILYREVGR